jgi:hypothetical protein
MTQTPVTVQFTDSSQKTLEPSEIKDFSFQDNGWISLQTNTSVVHYPPRAIEYIISENELISRIDSPNDEHT